MSNQHDPGPSNAHVAGQHDDYLMPLWEGSNAPDRRASNCTVESFEGNESLDAFSGISLTDAGHGTDALVEPAKIQLGEVVHVCTCGRPSQPAADLAKRPVVGVGDSDGSVVRFQSPPSIDREQTERAVSSPNVAIERELSA